MILSVPTLLCGIITSGVALGICFLDWVGAIPGNADQEWQQKVQAEQQKTAGLLAILQQKDAILFDLTETIHMRAAGLKCSVVNGKVVHDRNLPASKQCTCGSGSCERHSYKHTAYDR